MTGAPLEIQSARAAVHQTHSRNGSAAHTSGINLLWEVTELSYRCEVLLAEKAELEREKMKLLEKVGLLASERDHLKNALAAASNSPTLVSRKADGPTSVPWWKRMVSGWRGGAMKDHARARHLVAQAGG